MPKPIEDPVFGLLQWDEILSCWLGGIDWPPGLHTEVAIWQSGDDVAAALRMAHEGLDWIKAKEEHALRCVTSKMLELYNDAWRDEDEPISEEEFIRRTELVRIGFYDDGSLILSYDGRDMFGGHVIDGDFGADRSFRGANLVG
jgi:hypothetical protein